MRKKKILIFTVPFSGHLNVLRDLVLRYGSGFNFKLVITGWKNIKADLNDGNIPVINLAKTKLSKTDPALWTFPRVSDLLDDCLKIAKDFKPDIIIYDFFSLEGNLVGKILNIPYWCSIPAMIGPFENKLYRDQKLSVANNQKTIEMIQNKFGIKINQEDIEMISDGFHLPGQVNFIWSYRSLIPSNFKKNRSTDYYVFIGNLNQKPVIQKNTEKHTKPKIYFSFGTVVMNNLWNQQHQTRDQLKSFVKNIAALWKNEKIKVTFVCQGKRLVAKYPSNWRVIDQADQLKELSRADIFITHGGSNSFHEAVLYQIPMIVIPFFGDQPLVGRQVQNLGLGINLSRDQNIDTAKSKAFLNQELITKLNQSVWKIIRDRLYYQRNFSRLSLSKTPILSLLKGKYIQKKTLMPG